MLAWFKSFLYAEEMQKIKRLSNDEFTSLCLFELNRRGFQVANDLIVSDKGIYVVESSDKGFCVRYHGGHKVNIFKSVDKKIITPFMLGRLCIEAGLKINLQDQNKIVSESFFVTNGNIDNLTRRFAKKYRVTIVDVFSLAKSLKNTKLDLNAGVNVVSIFKHFDGYGIDCIGSPVEVLGIVKLVHFKTADEAYDTAKQIQKDTRCTINWICDKPSWAIDYNEYS